MCDTFVSIVPGKKGHSVIFGKNSDREPNEAQILEYCPPQSFSTKEKVHCTHISIPQVRETNGVLISRPFWMWGAEMGANDKGVVIGIEPVFTRMPYDRSGGLTGMDLLRLALERAESAEQGLEIIVELLDEYGQGGITGYQNKRLEAHSSFIIADASEAWVLETADILWAALKVKENYVIANHLTIGSQYDRCHPDLIEVAESKRFLKKGQEFSFADCFSDKLHMLFSASKARKESTESMLSRLVESGDITNAFDILRSHEAEPYDPSSHVLQNSICLHAGNTITRNANTTASLVAHLRSEDDNLYWATATSTPCTSVFKPIWMEGDVLPDLGPTPNGQFNSKSYWWYHERLHRVLLTDFSEMKEYIPEREQLQTSLIKTAYRLNPKERFSLTGDAFKESRNLTKKWWHKLKNAEQKNNMGLLYRKFWNKQNKNAELAV